jgi:hypothetical protein
MRSVVQSVFFATLLGIGTQAFAQSNTGTVTGTVKDEQGLALPGANVELIGEETGTVRPTTSAGNGAFTITAVAQGRYTLKVGLQGFKTVERRGIQLRSNETLDAGAVTLTIGRFEEVTTVTADPAVVQTASAEMSTTLESRQIDSLIARGRDPMALLRSLPGVSNAGDGPTSLGGTNGTGAPTIAGLNATGMSLDGMATNDVDTNNQISTISVDAIEEIKIITNDYQAEFGRNAGASISIVSKSGTRDFKGGYAYYARHEKLNANNYFNILNGLPKPFYRYNTGSGTLGGPIGRPGGTRNKMFFFYAREDWVTDEPRGVTRSTMPTALERQGDFSQTVDLGGKPIFIRDPSIAGGTCNAATGVGTACFAGNKISTDRISSYGRAILNQFPLPNFFDTAVSARNYNYQYQDIAHTTKAMNQLKVDMNPTRRDRLTVLMRNWDPLTTAYTGIFGLTSNYDELLHNYAKKEYDLQVKYVRTLGTKMVNELSVSHRQTHEIYSNVAYDAVSLNKWGMAGLPQLYSGANVHTIIPSVTFGGITNGANIGYDGRFPINAGDIRRIVSDNLSWAAAKHLVKTGFVYEYDYNSEGLNGNCYSVCLAFGTDSNNPLNSNYAFANALLGNFLSYSQSNARIFRGGRNSLQEAFVQDSWKPMRRLTLELGLRVSSAHPYQLDTLRFGDSIDVTDYAGKKVGASFVLSRFDKARQIRLYTPTLVSGSRVGIDQITGQVVPAALIGAIVPNSGDVFNGLVTQDDPMAATGWRNPPGPQWQPRLGFAYDLGGDGKTAIRGGFGVTKQSLVNSGSFANSVAAGPPASVQPTIFYGNLSSLSQSTGYLTPFGANGYAVDYTPQTVYNYSLNVQRNLGFGTVVSAAYVGNRARHIPLTQNINVLKPGARFDPANIDPTTNRVLVDAFLRPIIGYAGISIIQETGISDYNSLQVTVDRRFKNGLQYGAAYTLSSTHDMSGTVPLYHDAKSFLYDFAGSDQRHVLSLTYIWEIPGGNHWHNPIVRRLVDRWQLSGVTSFGSGRPSGVSFSTTDSADILGGGDANRIRVTCDPNLKRSERTFDRWFNTACFARPAKGDEGNGGRAVIRLPGYNTTDLNLSKMLVGRQGRGLQFRAEIYNAFNQVVWTAVNTAARFDTTGAQVNAQFGQVTAAANPRIVQLALRVMF